MSHKTSISENNYVKKCTSAQKHGLITRLKVSIGNVISSRDKTKSNISDLLHEDVEKYLPPIELPSWIQRYSKHLKMYPTAIRGCLKRLKYCSWKEYISTIGRLFWTKPLFALLALLETVVISRLKKAIGYTTMEKKILVKDYVRRFKALETDSGLDDLVNKVWSDKRLKHKEKIDFTIEISKLNREAYSLYSTDEPIYCAIEASMTKAIHRSSTNSEENYFRMKAAKHLQYMNHAAKQVLIASPSLDTREGVKAMEELLEREKDAYILELCVANLKVIYNNLYLRSKICDISRLKDLSFNIEERAEPSTIYNPEMDKLYKTLDEQLKTARNIDTIN